MINYYNDKEVTYYLRINNPPRRDDRTAAIVLEIVDYNGNPVQGGLVAGLNETEGSLVLYNYLDPSLVEAAGLERHALSGTIHVERG